MKSINYFRPDLHQFFTADELSKKFTTTTFRDLMYKKCYARQKKKGLTNMKCILWDLIMVMKKSLWENYAYVERKIYERQIFKTQSKWCQIKCKSC